MLPGRIGVLPGVFLAPACPALGTPCVVAFGKRGVVVVLVSVVKVNIWWLE